MKLSVSFLLLLLFCFYGCSDDKPTGPAVDTGNNLANIQIGIEGGTLSSDEIKLTIPAGAFGSQANLQLYKMGDNPFDSNSNSSNFKIEGIPDDFTIPLEMRINCSGGIGTNPLIAVGQNSYAPSSGERTAYRFIQAVDSGDFIYCLLEPSVSAGKSFSKINSTDAGTITMFFNAITGYEIYKSRNNHFSISYPFTLPSSDVSVLADYLEDSYDVFQTMGFSYTARTDWPVEVVVDKMDDKKYGEAVFKMYGYNTAWIEFNKSKINNYEQVKFTAGHEFFHIVQNLYYPPNSLSVATGKYTWLDEAFSVWSEELFTDNDDYFSPVRAGNEWAPFGGLQANSVESDEVARNHGYGVSAMIKYLVKSYRGNFPLDTYSLVTDNENPVDAVINTYGSPVEWWADFLADYIEGNIYKDVKPTDVSASLRSGRFDIKTDADTLKSFTQDFSDLSGKVYSVYLQNSGLDENASLLFSSSGGLSEVTVFKYNANEMVKIAGPGNDLEITKVKKIQDEGKNLVCLVSNCRALTPYTSSVSITTNIKLKKPEKLNLAKYTELQMIAKWHGTYSKQDGSGIEADVSRSFLIHYGNWNGNVYTAVELSSNDNYKDSVRVVIDPVTLMVTEFLGYHETTYKDSHEKYTGTNVQLQFDGTDYTGSVSGSTACSVLTCVEDYDGDPDAYVLNGYSCNSNSMVEIKFSVP